MSVVVNPPEIETVESSVTTGVINFNGTSEVTLLTLLVPAGKWLLLAHCSLEQPSTTAVIFITTATMASGRLNDSTRGYSTIRGSWSTQSIVTILVPTTFLVRTRQNTGSDTTPAYLAAVGAYPDPDSAMNFIAMRLAP